jgi:hypothetical protein
MLVFQYVPVYYSSIFQYVSVFWLKAKIGFIFISPQVVAP